MYIMFICTTHHVQLMYMYVFVHDVHVYVHIIMFICTTHHVQLMYVYLYIMYTCMCIHIHTNVWTWAQECVTVYM